MSEVAEDNRFAVTLPLTKAWTDEHGQMWVEGVASSTSLDRQRERMTKNAIAKMQQFAGIDLLPSHKAGPLEELGTVKECWVDNDSFRVRAQLEEMSPRAVRLFKRLAEGHQYGLSVGGRVTEAYWGFDQEAGGRVKYIDDVVLDHVAICRPQQAANPDTYLSVLAKAAEPVTTDGPPQDEEYSDDVLLRLGRAALEACRRLWPFGKSVPQPEDDPSPQPSEEIHLLQAEIADLRKQLQKIDTNPVAPGAEPDTGSGEQPQPGRRQSLVAEKRPTADNHNFWKGVL